MFNFLKGEQANLKLTLDRRPPSYTLGETVCGTVTIVSESDLPIRQARVVLLCQEEFKRHPPIGSGDANEQLKAKEDRDWRTIESETSQYVLLGKTTIIAGSPQIHRFALPVPLDTPPTCSGAEIIRIKWMVKAALDVPLAPDVEERTEISILTTPPGQKVGIAEYGFSNEPEEAELSFSLPCKEWVLGEPITGRFFVSPKREFDVTEIRVELARSERVHGDRLNVYCAEMPLVVAGATRLKPSENLVFPFSLPIPFNAPVTLRTTKSSVRWQLRGVLARPLRLDTRVVEEIFIYGSPAGLKLSA